VCFQVITAAGNVKHEDIVQQAKELFNKLPTDPTTTGMLVAEEPATFTGSEVCILL
jgi:processing peptidase subunit beta